MWSSRLMLHLSAVFLAVCTLILLVAGALVTGTGSGLAVPDWPLSFGTLNPPMVGGILFEHGHRLIAGSVGIITVLVAVFFKFVEDRTWVKWLAGGAVFAVVVQALLGGLTVLLRLPFQVSAAHACLAQIFFTTSVILALVTSPWWRNAKVQGLGEETGAWVSIRSFCLILNGAFFLQLLMGAIMRHSGAGLAIPDFPTAFGGFLPPYFDFGIAIHFAHRMGAFTLFFLVLALTVKVYRYHSSNLTVMLFTGVVAALTMFQIMLGATVIWLQRPLVQTTMHLVLGACILASSALLTLVVARAGTRAPIPSALGFGTLEGNPA